MPEKISHSFEAGRRGKPDELESGIANLIGAYLMELNTDARFDLRVSGTWKEGKPLVRVSGEMSDFLLKISDIEERISGIILSRYNWIHRTELKPDEIITDFNFKPQAHPLASNNHAGDSGSPIAVAYKDTPNCLPWERYLAVAIRDFIDSIYHNGGIVPQNIAGFCGIEELKGLRADGKVSVEAKYNSNCKLDGLTKIKLAIEHEPALPIEELRYKVNTILTGYLRRLEGKYNCSFDNPTIDINGADAWHQGGWQVDEGNREAKPYRDGFASYGCCEDSFSGEDPTKPSGTGTFIARYVAVQVIGNNLADFARVALSYTIGRETVGLNVVTNGTSLIPQDTLEDRIRQRIPLRIKEGIHMFDLKNPKLYKQIAADSDYFQNPGLPWNVVERDLR